jgi:PPOX class probable F420-dependent enzyme
MGMTTTTKTPNTILEPFVHQPTVLLTTYRKVGTPVGTPVSIAVDGEVAYVRSWSTAGKMKRIRNNPTVDVEPSTMRGRPTGGPKFRARARLLTGDQAARARKLINKKHPMLHGILVPMAHRLARYETVHLELTPLELGSETHKTGKTG